MRLPLQASVSAERALLVLAICLPFCNVARFPPDPSTWSDWCAVSLFALWCLIRRRCSNVRFVGAIPLMILVVAGVVTLQLTLGMAAMPVRSLVATAVLVLAFLITQAGGDVRVAQGQSGTLRTACLAMAAALAANLVAVVLAQLGYEILVFDLVRIDPMARAVGLVGQSNHLATLAVLALAGVIYCAAGDRRWQWVIWPTAAASAYTCAASGSRIGVVAWGVLLAICGLARRWWPNGAAPRGSPTFRQIAILGAIFIVVQGAWLAWPRDDAAPSVTTAARIGGEGRADMLVGAYQLWKAHPILGVGHGNYAERRLRDLDGELHSPNASNAHNVVAQAFAEWGVVGGGAVAMALGLLLRRCWQALHPLSGEAENWLVVAWIVILLLHSMVEHPLWFARWLLPFSLMIGLLPQPALPWRFERPVQGRASVVALALGVVAISVVSAWDYARIQSMTVRMVREIHSTGQARVSFADASDVALLTLFPVSAQILLARGLPMDPDFAVQERQIAERAMNAIPNRETISRYLAFSLLLGDTDTVVWMESSLARRNPRIAQEVHDELEQIMRTTPRGAAFLAAQKAARSTQTALP